MMPPEVESQYELVRAPNTEAAVVMGNAILINGYPYYRRKKESSSQPIKEQ